MKKIIEAFDIFSKYTSDECVTHCEHDLLCVCINPDEVSDEDKKRLEELHFKDHDGECFTSSMFGSC